MKQIQEELKFIRSDGAIYHLQALPERAVIKMSGWGKPDNEIQTRGGPFQQGETAISARLQPRHVTCTINHRTGCRADWWDERNTLLNQMGNNNASTNSPVPGTLIWRRVGSDGKPVTRALDVFLVDGLVYNPPNGTYSVNESLDFIAYNPVIYDPALQTETLEVFRNSLILPVPFPLTLCTYEITLPVTYEGTWESYPTVEIDGPASDVGIFNISTGYGIRLDYPASYGETVTINSDPANPAAYNSFGTPLNRILVDSNLGQFSLLPHPRLTDGVNSLWITLGSWSFGETEIRINYYNRYYGI